MNHRLLAFITLLTLACGRPGAQEAEVDILLLGGTIVTADARNSIFDPGFLSVADGRIVGVGPLEQAKGIRASRTIQASDTLILPGLINGHQHAAMSLMRGVADDMRLMEWLHEVMFPIEAQVVNEEFVYWGTLLSAAEMIATGTTAFADMYYFEEKAAEAVDRSGMRGILGETVIGFPSPDAPTPQEALQRARRFLQEWRNHPRVIPAVAPHSPYTCSQEVLTASRDLAAEMDAPLLIHLSETQEEVDQLLRETGMRPIEYLDRIGFLSERVIAAHVVWASDAEIELLKRRGVGVIHNPESNMKLASGVAPIPNMLLAGIPIGLGTDGPVSNNNLDLFQEMDSMAKLHKVFTGDPTVVTAREAFLAATREGARAIGMDSRIGSLETGKEADFVILSRKHPAAHPLYDPYSAIVYALDGRGVRQVFVAGEEIYRDGVFRGFELEQVLEKAASIQSHILQVVAEAQEKAVGELPILRD